MESKRILIGDRVLSRQDLLQEKERTRRERAKLSFEEKIKILVNLQRLAHHWGGEKISSYRRSRDCSASPGFRRKGPSIRVGLPDAGKGEPMNTGGLKGLLPFPSSCGRLGTERFGEEGLGWRRGGLR